MNNKINSSSNQLMFRGAKIFSLACLTLGYGLLSPLGFSSKPASVPSALESIQQKQLQEAAATLDRIDLTDPAYRISYGEIQKLHYKTQSWDKFFGYATFYRKKMLPQFFEPNLLILEMMGLLKHCQLDTATNLLLMSRELAAKLKEGQKSKIPQIQALVAREQLRRGASELPKVISKFEDDLRAVENLVILQSKMPGYVTSEAVKRSFAAFSKTLFWNISQTTQDLMIEKALKTPRLIRIYVENQCGSKKEASL